MEGRWHDEQERLSLHDGANKMSLCILPEKPFHRSLPIANPSIPILFSFFPPLSFSSSSTSSSSSSSSSLCSPATQPESNLTRFPAADIAPRASRNQSFRFELINVHVAARNRFNAGSVVDFVHCRAAAKLSHFTSIARFYVRIQFTNVMKKLSRSPLSSNLVEFSFDLKI